MATANVKRGDLGDLNLEGLADVGVVGNFVLFRYENGVVVLEKDIDIDSVQFTPTPSATEEDDPSKNN